MSYIMLEYVCRGGHRTESLEERAHVSDVVKCETCGKWASRAISAVATKTVWGSAAVRGKSDPPPSPYAMDSVGVVGESRTRREWKEKRSAMWKDFDRNRRRKSGAPI